MRNSRAGKAGTSFVQCQQCKKTLFAAEFETNLRVCGHCGHHHRLTWDQRVRFTFDEGSFVEEDRDLRSGDPLQFPEYRDKHAISVAKTGLQDSVISGTASIEGCRVAVAVADFHFMGGSMGSVAGEKFTRTLERAVEKKIPALVFCASGGARMQEGLLSLMQMAKTTAAVQRCRENGVPFICVFTDPTMAGVLASFASVADVIIAEPKALVGFAGARVSKQAQVVKAPDDFQTAEFAFRAGMIDRIVERRDLRGVLADLVEMFGAHLRQGARVG
jgi:acetyl-CoA carboxylase carboxyl transferase subunit beta